MNPAELNKVGSRRGALGAISGLGAIALAACGGGGSAITSSGSSSSSSSSGSSSSTTTTASNDASLSALTVSTGTLSPVFAAGTTSYAVSVANTVTTVTLTASTTYAGASVKISGVAVPSGVASSNLSLTVGANDLSVLVTAADGTTTRSYTVVVTRAAAAAGTCTLTPQETQGPYPLLAILSNTAVVRKDMTEGKTGVPLTVKLNLMKLANSCAPIAGAAIYIWHCDKDGIYSGYDVQNNTGQEGKTFLRGIQVTDANGSVEFTTIYPGWYAGRITHIHFQIYLNNNLSVTATATSQLAFPLDVTAAVYSSSLYTKGQNTSVTSFASDNVFSDGTTFEMTTVTGSVSAGYVATLNIGIA